MNELQQVLNFEGAEIRTIIIDKEPWFVAKDICEAVELSNTSKALQRLPENMKRITSGNTNMGSREMAIINEMGLKKLITSSRSIKAIEIAKIIGIDVLNSYNLCKEQELLDILSKTFNHIEHFFQYTVGCYKIDMYFPQYKLAIECDEYGHDRRDISQEIKRQNYIENKLGCKFIRFNPDGNNFNIGNVINKILLHII